MRVGYSNYPDNVLEEFIKESAAQGIDVFRIVDSLKLGSANGKKKHPSSKGRRQNCRKQRSVIPEISMIRLVQKYSIDYYKAMAKELQNLGAHIIAIKDMAGLLKPQAAYRLISELKASIDVPIHLHNPRHEWQWHHHLLLPQTKAGVDIVDVAMSAVSGATSQPSMSSLYYALVNGERLSRN